MKTLGLIGAGHIGARSRGSPFARLRRRDQQFARARDALRARRRARAEGARRDVARSRQGRRHRRGGGPAEELPRARRAARRARSSSTPTTTTRSATATSPSSTTSRRPRPSCCRRTCRRRRSSRRSITSTPRSSPPTARLPARRIAARWSSPGTIAARRRRSRVCSISSASTPWTRVRSRKDGASSATRRATDRAAPRRSCARISRPRSATPIAVDRCLCGSRDFLCVAAIIATLYPTSSGWAARGHATWHGGWSTIGSSYCSRRLLQQIARSAAGGGADADGRGNAMAMKRWRSVRATPDEKTHTLPGDE